MPQTRPRIAIDLRPAAAPLNGFGRFSRNLLDGLARIGPPEPILLLCRPDQAVPDDVRETPGFVRMDVAHSPYPPLGQRRLARRLAAAGVEMMASPDSFAPFAGRPRQVITIHDIIPLRCPRLLHRSAKGRFAPLWRQWLRVQIANADLVLTVSEHARADIGAVFPQARKKLRTVYNAVPAVQAPGSKRRSTPAIARLLYVGRAAPYKNVVGCIETLAELRRSSVTAHLTIVGQPDRRYPEVERTIDRLGLGDRVTVTGHVDEARLRTLYREATLFLFLSRYEGFGLPPLEAMAHGVPVVSSDRASMPEVLGDAALLVDPDDPSARVEAVRRVIEQPAIAEDLARRGRQRAAGFTVERQATMFWKAIAPLLPSG